jgi:hypothetical protein
MTQRRRLTSTSLLVQTNSSDVRTKRAAKAASFSHCMLFSLSFIHSLARSLARSPASVDAKREHGRQLLGRAEVINCLACRSLQNTRPCSKIELPLSSSPGADAAMAVLHSQLYRPLIYFVSIKKPTVRQEQDLVSWKGLFDGETMVRF